MKLSLATASFLILCTAASAQTAETYRQDPACKAAIEKECPGVKPGGGRIKACLEQNHVTLKQLCPGDVGKKHAGTVQSAPVTAGTPPIAAPMATPPAGQ